MPGMKAVRAPARYLICSCLELVPKSRTKRETISSASTLPPAWQDGSGCGLLPSYLGQRAMSFELLPV